MERVSVKYPTQIVIRMRRRTCTKKSWNCGGADGAATIVNGRGSIPSLKTAKMVRSTLPQSQKPTVRQDCLYSAFGGGVQWKMVPPLLLVDPFTAWLGLRRI